MKVVFIMHKWTGKLGGPVFNTTTTNLQNSSWKMIDME